MSEKEENSDDKMEIDSNGSTENGIAETIDPKDIKKEPMEEDEESGEDDPIVKEIPVFLSKGLSKNLFLFQVMKQYPIIDARSTFQYFILATFEVITSNSNHDEIVTKIY